MKKKSKLMLMGIFTYLLMLILLSVFCKNIDKDVCYFISCYSALTVVTGEWDE